MFQRFLSKSKLEKPVTRRYTVQCCISTADNFSGYGFGLRFLVPFVNMFRVDFGFGEPDKSVRLHIGAFEKPVAQRFRVR